ncbi:MAG: helix-turn-helix domain-containing protein [Clostridia bacterium]|nr:helix-turn-helix domain-containing protein [Clostridia bacterium]
MNLSKFSDVLENLIFDSGISKQDFAKAAKIPLPCIVSYTKNHRAPTVATLLKIADYFKCSTDYLLGREESRSATTFKKCPPFAEQLEFLRNYYKFKDFVQFRRATGLSKNRFLDWQNGKRQPSLENIIKMADCFDCRVDFILGRES